MKKCPRCTTELPLAARFCWNCGASQPEPPPPPSGMGDGIDWKLELLPQFNARFLAALRSWVEADFGASNWTAYQEKLYECGFRDVVHRRLSVLADQLSAERVQLHWSAAQASRRLAALLFELIEYFVVYYGDGLNPVYLSQAILRHQASAVNASNIFTVVLDYLDFAHEQEMVYTDLLLMPVDKLRQAGRSYLFPAKDERILLVCDQSLLGSGKEGFALTEKAIYWKAQFQPAQQLAYTELRTLVREKDWLSLNGHFFNANPTLNLKMLLLLKRLQLSFC